jgi:alkanesulfonate monooxygenase SsuD/methylene tetrahydromethanopterin reductase-like flavin-dependent oxidoreductase (luciferase family)
VRKFVEAYQEESRKAGRNLNLGENVGVVHAVYFADSVANAYKLAEAGICGVAFKKFFHHFGFSEAWRLPEDEAKYPTGKVTLPASEITMERLQRCKFMFAGTVADVRREMDELVENVHPEWFVWQADQGFLPKDEVKRQLEICGKEILPRYR